MALHETEALWAFAAEELEAEASSRVAEHVAGCEVCARKLAEVRQARALLTPAREDEPAVRWAEVDERVQVAAARRLARMEQRPRWPWALVAAGAMAAVVAFLVPRPVAAPAPTPSPPVAVREPPPEVPASPPAEVAAPAEPVLAARVESATGAWIREPQAPERSLEAGAQLREGASVRTRVKASALLRLPDESRVRLSPDSEVTLERAEAEDVRLTITRGQLAVQASHVARRGFTVEAAGVRASVVGTVFSVERTPRGAVVAVLEGRVRVEAEGQPVRLVSAGERVEVRPGSRPSRVRAISARERQVFLELGALMPAEHSAPRGASSVVAGTAPPVPEAPEEEAILPAEPASPPPVSEAPSAEEEPGSEFAPYPVPTNPEPVDGVVVAPSPAASEVRQGLERSSSADASFLLHARDQLNAKTCESFLVGLAEIAEQSQVRLYREHARYLRARCFEERLARAEAAAEYRRYLREYPRGRFVREARAALLP